MEFFSTVVVGVFAGVITSCVTAMVIVAALFFFINKVKKVYKKAYKRAKEEIFRFFYVPTVLKKHMREVAENTNKFLRSWRHFVNNMIFNLKKLLNDSLISAFRKIDYKGKFFPKIQIQEPVPVVLGNETEDGGFVNINLGVKDDENDDWLNVDDDEVDDFEHIEDIGGFEDFEDVGEIDYDGRFEDIGENNNF